jgi:hypothetical protein
MNEEAPKSLVVNGRLAFHDIYRTAELNANVLVLIKGKVIDQFPDIIQNVPWDSRGELPCCDKYFGNGSYVHSAQWQTLQVWHAGISCMLSLKPEQEILFDTKNTNFLLEFNNPRRKQYVKNENSSFRIFLVYELRKGSVIPPGIGIEIDGENHVTLYPIGDHIPVSEIEPGFSSFTIDILRNLQSSWMPFAICKVKASGFIWPEDFPSDTDLFPFRKWLASVINCGESEIAIDASRHTEKFCDRTLDVHKYLSIMLDLARRFALDCSYEDIGMNFCMVNSLRFVLDIEMVKKQR